MVTPQDTVKTTCVDTMCFHAPGAVQRQRIALTHQKRRVRYGELQDLKPQEKASHSICLWTDH